MKEITFEITDLRCYFHIIQNFSMNNSLAIYPMFFQPNEYNPC